MAEFKIGDTIRVKPEHEIPSKRGSHYFVLQVLPYEQLDCIVINNSYRTILPTTFVELITKSPKIRQYHES